MVALTNIAEKFPLTQYLVDNKLIHLNILDIGARGGFAPYWKVYRDCLEIMGFDPDREQARISEGRCKARALSGDGKERIFYLIRYPASSSFYPPNVDFTNRLQNRDYLNIMNTIEIQTTTLDSLNVTPDFIKLDTEGSELEILQGGAKTLSGVLGVSVEVGFTELFKGQPLFRDVDRFLQTHGFNLYDLSTSRLARWRPGRQGMSDGKCGQVVVGQALYFRDIYPLLSNYGEQTILKLASLFEVFNLSDCAYEILNAADMKNYRDMLGV